MNTVDQMKLFMEPESVALIGVSRQTGRGAWNILENLLNSGYSGRVYPVNSKADEILGKMCYHSVKDIPETTDLAVVSTPRSGVPKIVRECTEKGIKAITVVAQGFADADEEGRELQEEIVNIAREGGARILGPNTLGTANAFNSFSSSFAPMVMERVPIGIIAQTGFLFAPGFPSFTVVGKAIGLGNACDIDLADGLEYFENDPQVRLILLHIEGIRDGRRFMEVARRVTKKKPIIALKAGRSDEGARAAQSHTASLAGRDEVYDAAFKQCGVIRISDVDEFEDLQKAFLKLPLMKGKGVGVLSLSGACGIMATDALEKYNFRLARLSPRTLEKINTLAPSWQRLGNPADLWPAIMIAGHPMQEVLTAILEAFLNDGDVYGIVIVLGAFGEGQSIVDFTLLPPRITAKFRGKPVVSWVYGPGLEVATKDLEERGGILAYPTVERAARVLSRLNHYWEYLM